MSEAVATSSRPSGSETRQRSGIVGFRANTAERAELERLADRAGLSLSAYVRSGALAAPTTRATRRPPIERAALVQLLGQIGKIGGNINQIARAENRGRDVEDLPDIMRLALGELTEMKEALMEALGRMPR